MSTTKEKILTAALALFAANGYEAVSDTLPSVRTMFSGSIKA